MKFTNISQLVLLILLCSSTSFVHALTFTVTSTDDNGDAMLFNGSCEDVNGNCTLRAALQEAQLSFGADTILFNIPGAGPHRIQPASPLSQLTGDIFLDGSSQPGYSFSNPQVVLDGSLTPAGTNGLHLTGDNCAISGLAIVGFQEDASTTPISGGAAVFFDGVQNCRLTACFLGLEADGSTPNPNYKGVQMTTIGAFSSRNNLIGGTGAADRNVISGNEDAGLYLEDSDLNQILGNYIGTDKNGTFAVPNLCGIAISSSTANIVGGNTAAARNLISGNTQGGMDLTLCSSTIIQGNYIGTNAAGTQAIPNTYGINLRLFNNDNQIGGNFSTEGNLISGNDSMGIKLVGVFNRIQGNRIGVQADGISPLGNGEAGISIPEGNGNEIGGPNSTQGNIIAFHGGDGIRIHAATGSTESNLISHNAIFRNMGIGIDLGFSFASNPNKGKTPNDATASPDADTGANRLQNFAMMTATYDAGSNTLTITYEVPSDPLNSAYPLTVEFYAGDPADANPQGQQLVGTDTYTALDYAAGPKTITFNPAFPVVLTGAEPFVNTVTDDNNNTSEFSFTPVLDGHPLSLQAAAKARHIELSWQHQQSDVVGYELERAAVGGRFEAIFYTSHLQPDMRFEDQHPLPGTNRYRLRLLKADGAQSHSNLVEVQWEVERRLWARFEGPTLHIGLLAGAPLPTHFELFSLNGQRLAAWEEQLQKGENAFSKTFVHLPHGIYVLRSRRFPQGVKVRK